MYSVELHETESYIELLNHYITHPETNVTV